MASHCQVPKPAYRWTCRNARSNIGRERATRRGSDVMADPGKVLPPLVLCVGDGFGFEVPSPAKIALADGLEIPGSAFELRIHGVGGSSPEKLLDPSDTTQVGGERIA